MHFFKHFQAAEYIRNEGIAGANRAVELIGIDAVIAMLSIHLNVYDSEKLRLFRDAGLTQIAEISYSRCIVWEEGSHKPIAAFEIQQKETGDPFCASIPIEGLNVPMWMCGVQLSLFAGKAPYTEVQEILLARYRQFSIEQGLPQT